MYKLLKPKAPFLFAVALAFFVFLLAVFARSVPALHYITVDTIELVSNGFLWAYAWFGWELIGEVGLIVRIAGAAFFLALAVMLLRKKSFSLSLLRKGVLLEGVYYIFNLPATIFLFIAAPQICAGFIAGIGAAISFTAQMLIVTPIFLTLYLKLGKQSVEHPEVVRWMALGVIGFTFALWFKHFALALYALPFNSQDAVLAVGFLNSALTLLIAGVFMVAAFLPLLRKKAVNFNAKLFGVALSLVGIYAAIFVVVAFLDTDYMRWINLIDLWVIAMPILGVSVFRNR